ncbi:hypothetical protein BIU88_10135 [Chlorobaculum limnaeum]|uniref:Uncharacterized protein n=1 Tax=Chlorobaculum limnaeum TaxID=274537 RepID=A0A1D8D8B7_CHLLM|nr:hypothetical protein [Chlorobaculum limnaeum]AOS84458.1 hypothetical protein BIU88_10135 [Chlorobaculum limnaeum]
MGEYSVAVQLDNEKEEGYMQKVIDDIDAAWEQEILDRILAVEGGTAEDIDYDEAMKMILADKSVTTK